MAKNLKLKIKNTQIAAAINLGSLKEKLGKAKEPAPEVQEAADAAGTVKRPKAKAKAVAKPEVQKDAKADKESKSDAKSAAAEPAPQRVRARSRSVFGESPAPTTHVVADKHEPAPVVEETVEPAHESQEPQEPAEPLAAAEAAVEPADPQPVETITPLVEEPIAEVAVPPQSEPATPAVSAPEVAAIPPPPAVPAAPRPVFRKMETRSPMQGLPADLPSREKLGPTGRHIRDLLPPPKPPKPAVAPAAKADEKTADGKPKSKTQGRTETTTTTATTDDKRGVKSPKFKEYQDVKPAKRSDGPRAFDARDRQGLRETDDENSWRRRRKGPRVIVAEPTTIRPTQLTVRLPISIKDLAVEMKLKASQLIEKLFLQGALHTINDFLDDETTIGLIGHEFGCTITIDTKEEERIRITGKTVREEVAQSSSTTMAPRPPVVAFMGHVDHGKTSLIDAIRKSNRVAGEAGAITQHIGAFQCHTPVGDITVLDTPGHEAFSAMRARGADVTDIVVLVVAGDEGIRQQTIEAIQHAKAANVTIVVAINKLDKPNFNAENVYRQLSEQELLPEAWGGQTITVNCSAATGEGVNTLLEMLALQTEILELKADPKARARGRVIESEMHKGMGATATVLVLNGTLKQGDALVFDQYWGRIKTLRNDLGQTIQSAGPSMPVSITGLSGLPEAGQEFIVVPTEREAREIAEKRMFGFQQNRLQQTKRLSMENLVQQAGEADKKVLNLILLADVQGSLEALQVSLKKITSNKVMVNIISTGVGEISESDVQLASTSKAVIIGFHCGVESHAEDLLKQTGVQVRLHDIIYHAVDDVKVLMAGLLERIALETEKGKAEVLEIFKSSQLGSISGCRVIEGSIARSHQMRVKRGDAVIWKGGLSSLKRVKEDVREVVKGLECGIVLNGFRETQVGDILESYEITYIDQQL